MQAQPVIPYILTFLGIYLLVWIAGFVLQTIVWRRLKKLKLAPPAFFDAGIGNSLNRMRYLLSEEYKTLPNAELVNLLKWLRRSYLAIFAFMASFVLLGVCVIAMLASQQKG